MRHLLLFSAFCFYSILHAQSPYQLFHAEVQYIYDNPITSELSLLSSPLMGILVQEGTCDSTYQTVFEDPNNGGCEGTKIKPAFIGQHICQGASSTTLDLGDGRNLILRPQAVVGESWQAIDDPSGHVFARVDSITFGFLAELDLQDSIKHISLWQELDVNQIEFEEGSPFQISKNYGLVASPFCWALPEIFPLLKISGLSNPKLGHQNIGINEIFDLMPGDEIHRRHINDQLVTVSMSEYYYGHFEDRILITNRSFDTMANVLNFTIDREKKQFFTDPFPPNDFTDTIYSTTASEIWSFDFSELAWLDAQPGSIYMISEQDDQFIHTITIQRDTLPCDRISKRFESPGFYDGECFFFILDVSPSFSYYEGLAGGYGIQQNLGPAEIRSLVYYNKNGETCGAPLDFVVANKETVSFAQFEVFPNPVRNLTRVTLETPPDGEYSYSLLSLSGQKHFLKTDHAQNVQLDFSGFPAGNYLLFMENKGELIGRKKIVLIP